MGELCVGRGARGALAIAALARPRSPCPLLTMGRRYGHLATGEPPGTRSAGAPSIGYWNSVLLMVNNVVGVGLVSLPALFQQAGWLPASCMLLVFMCLAACASVMLCEALALIPGNERFQKQIEYTGAVKWCVRAWLPAAG